MSVQLQVPAALVSVKERPILIVFKHSIRGQVLCGIARAERDGTRAETRIRLSPKRTSPFKSVGGVSSVDYWQSRSADQ